jgi:hypothetical protein
MGSRCAVAPGKRTSLGGASMTIAWPRTERRAGAVKRREPLDIAFVASRWRETALFARALFGKAIAAQVPREA